MSEHIIQSNKQGKQIDNFLRMILAVLDEAPDNNGKVLYIRGNTIAFGDGNALFNIIPLS